jgi:glycosyltransferase involved in cell wall biosynthesis
MKPRVAILVFRQLGVRNGVSRTISTISAYFKERAVIITDVYNAKATHRMSDRTAIHQLGPAVISSPIIPLRIIKILLASAEVKRIAKESGIKFLSAHGFYSLLCSCIAKLLSMRKLRVSWLVYDDVEICSPFRRLAAIFLARVGLVDQLLVLSAKMKVLARAKLKVSNVSVIRLGVSLELIELSHQYAEDRSQTICDKSFRRDGRIKLYFHGLLNPGRRIEDLLEAVAIVNRESERHKVMLYISDGFERNYPYLRELQDLIARLNLKDDTILLGSVNDDARLAIMYKSCDIFVFPCEHQSWGLAPLEAMLFKKPVIVSSDTGVSEVLENWRNAVIVPTRSPESLAGAILKLIADEPARLELGKKGRGLVLKNLTYVSTGQQLDALWATLETAST